MKYISIFFVTIILLSCGNKPNSEQQPTIPSYPVIEIPVRSITGQSTYPVSLEGTVNNEVRAKIPGYITKVLVDEGQFVRKGQLLFQLETRSMSEEAQAAKANVDAAQVGVDQLKPLVEQNIISKVQLETAEARLAQAKAAYNSIVANIGYSEIRSPINGYVGAIQFRQGSLVNPSGGAPLTTVSHTDQVYGYFSMNEADYINFLQSTPGKTLNEKMNRFPAVRLRLANGEVYKHEGKIQTVTAQIDPSTGTVSFRAVFPNPEHLLANGSSGTIIIPKPYDNVIVVPEESTYEVQGKTYVYQLMPDTTVASKIIDVEDRVDNLLIVNTGIAAGDKIVGQGAGNLRDAQRINPIPTPFDSLATNIKPVFQ